LSSGSACARTFDDLMASLDRDGFIGDFWGRKFGHFRGSSDRFDQLFGWAELECILQTRAIDVSRLKLFRSGKAVDAERYIHLSHGQARLKPASLVNCLGEGASLILDSVHDHAPAVRELALSCERAFSAITVVNAYAAWRSAHGFDLHWDQQDTFVLQIAGRKHWQIFEPTRLHPLGGESQRPPKPTAPPVWNQVLEEGDCLYLPRGWWHVAKPLDEPSLHLTVTLMPPAGPDLLSWFAEKLQQHAFVRANLPTVASAADRVAYVRRMRDLISQEWSDSVLEEFLSAWQAEVPPQAELGLPDSPYRSVRAIEPETKIRLAGDRLLSIFERPNGVVSFQANGARWECPTSFSAALRRLTDSSGVEMRELCNELPDRADRTRFLALLATLQMAGAIWLD
jgi:ribosomal protein L16 Arg81 hydroxylase